MIPTLRTSSIIPTVIRLINQTPRVKRFVGFAAKVAELGYKTFPIIQGISYGGYGVKLFFWDGLRVKIKIYACQSNASVKNVSLALQWFYERIKLIQSKSSDYGVFGGISYVSGGGCWALVGLGRLGIKGFSTVGQIAGAASRGFFLFSDLLSLDYYMNLFFNASKISRLCTGNEKRTALQVQIAAAMGIASCFLYLFGAAIILFGGPIGAAFVLSGIAASTSCLRVIYDFFYRSPEVYI